MTRRSWVALTIVVLVAVGMWIVLRPATPSAAALQALQSDETVDVDDDRWLVFQPAGVDSQAGLVFYPGGLVPAEAYAPLARRVAEAGYLVVIPHMPLNLAVLDSSVANDVVREYDTIDNWAVGGHSLGGAMAASYASDANDVAGLVMVGAYPADSLDLRTAAIEVLVIYGTEDGLSSPDEMIASAAQYPPDAVFVVIEGGNHAQFGSYGDQRGDNPATLSSPNQLNQTAAAIVSFLEQLDDS